MVKREFNIEIYKYIQDWWISIKDFDFQAKFNHEKNNEEFLKCSTNFGRSGTKDKK